MGIYSPLPVNIYVAPDGQTVIACDGYTTTLSIFRIRAPGVLSFEGYVRGLSREVAPNSSPGVQSLAFNTANSLIYAVINGRVDKDLNNLSDQVAVLKLESPGRVFLSRAECRGPAPLYSR